MQIKKNLDYTPKYSSGQSSEPSVNLSILFSECRQHLYSNSGKMKGCLANLKKAIPSNDTVHQIQYLHNSALYENQYGDYEASYALFQQAADLLENVTVYKDKAAFYIDYIGTCMNLDKLEEASALTTEVEKILQDKPDSLLKPKLLCRQGYWNIKLSHWADATRLLFEALDLFYKSSDLLSITEFHFISQIYSGLGRIYEKTNDPDKSLESYLNAISICEKHNLKTRIGWHYLNAGNALAMLDEPTLAISYFKKVLVNTADIEDTVRASAFANWGNCLFDENLASTAIGLYNKAEEIYNKSPEINANNLAIIYKWKGQIFAQANDYASASSHFNRALEFAKKTNNYRELASICEETASLYAIQQQYQKAYEFQFLKAEYDELEAEKVNLKTIKELELKYSTERKKQEIEKLEYQAKALQLRALRAQMNPHFLFNSLNSIQNFIAKNDRDEASTYLASFAKLMRKSLDYSELESISLEKEVDFLEHYLFINKHLRFRNRLDYKINIDPELIDEDYEIPSMIVQPYVENAIEHGLRSIDAGLITVSFDLLDEDTIRCTVTDNGIGRANAAANKNNNPDLQLHKSKGTQITLDRLSMLNSQFKPEELVRIEDHINTTDGQNCGTKVTVLIPVN